MKGAIKSRYFKTSGTYTDSFQSKLYTDSANYSGNLLVKRLDGVNCIDLTTEGSKNSFD